jgi:anti-anti-sigma factor
MKYSRPALAAVSVQVEIDIAVYRPEGCRIWSTGGLPVVSLPAEVDIANTDLLRSALLEVCTGDSVVVVDMTITTLLTAAGVGILAPIGKRLQDAGGELRLVVGNARVQLVLELLKMDRLFRTFTNLPEALASDRRDPLSYDQAA